jgi:starch synthase (maltosyl-transferring)
MGDENFRPCLQDEPGFAQRGCFPRAEALTLNSPTIEIKKLVPTLKRVVIEGVEPEVDGGEFAIKRTVGERVVVQADIFADGHEVLGAVLLYRPWSEAGWRESAMEPLENDRWRGEFRVEELGSYVYTVRGWVDAFHTWSRDLLKKAGAGDNLSIDLLTGAGLIRSAAARARAADARRLLEIAAELQILSGADDRSVVERMQDPELCALMSRYPDPGAATTYSRELRVVVERERARFSAWYEMFPRSCTSERTRHGTFRDCIDRLDYVAGMRFDVLYFPPIHPIGRTGRKGKNNSVQLSPEDAGSPWAIGAKEGGHKAIDPRLGTLDDFKLLQAKARGLGIELALDLAFQCSPDHPYVKEHPEWFRHRPDGSIQYAQNPPKKYEDIYPFDFENEPSGELCQELKSIVGYWVEQGIRIFRVDNPHTKPFSFWEWLIEGVRRDHPDVIFLAEAFTRPKVMYRLAKLGFTQSYTYFAWKNTKPELTEYFTELTQTPIRDFFRPNIWPNTPDILNEYLQNGGRPAFMARLILAATLGANYGIYGPAFELFENRPIHPGSEEYLDSEKYQIRVWPLDRPDSLRDLIARVNGIRRENAALQSDSSLRFHAVDNDELIAYSKSTEGGSEIILVIVNLDPRHSQSGWVQIPLSDFGLDRILPFQVDDLLSGAHFQWQGARNYVELNPATIPAHILKVRR